MFFTGSRLYIMHVEGRKKTYNVGDRIFFTTSSSFDNFLWKYRFSYLFLQERRLRPEQGTKKGFWHYCQNPFLHCWCERGESNPHTARRQILSLVRLPVPPPSHPFYYKVKPQLASQPHSCSTCVVPYAT